MVALVSGFTSAVAALKFEWALTNPHLSMHIPSQERISISTQRKRNGMPKRPRSSMTSIMSNIHLLLGVPSFSRWPLRLHFFNADVHKVWEKTKAAAKEPLRPNLPVITDFGPSTTTSARTLESEDEGDAPKSPSWGINALPVDYVPIKDYVAKGREVFGFEREGHCVVCREHMPPGEGVYALCANDGCEGVGHLSCWSRHLIPPRERQDSLLPVDGTCPKCSGKIQWVDMMKELTLRTRGSKEVDRLLKKKRVPKAKAKTKATAEATATP